MRDGLRRLIVSGSLPLGEKLPSVEAAVPELLYLGKRSEDLRRRIPEGGTNHD